MPTKLFRELNKICTVANVRKEQADCSEQTSCTFSISCNTMAGIGDSIHSGVSFTARFNWNLV